jgi:Uma2 family endonuclease
MSSAALISLEEYLHRSEKPLCEYMDGALQPKPMPTKLHGLIQYRLVTLLRQQNVEALAEVTVRVSETKFLIPDVIAARAIHGPYPTEPVLLCAEILSLDDRLGATLAKCEHYHAWGVPFCWIIDPQKQTAWHYHAGGEPERVEVLTEGGLSVRLKDLFAEVHGDE